MEENNVNSKTKLKVFIVALIALLMIALVGVIGFQIWKNEPGQKSPVGSEITNVTITSSDEKTLRELLLSEEEMTITLTEDIRIDESLIVRGNKTLCGDHSITMELYAEQYQGILVVSNGAELTFDGVTLDCNSCSYGIVVKLGGKLTCLSGNILYGMPYAITVSGYAKVEDITINEALHTGIYVDTAAELYMEGGLIKNVREGGIYVGGYAHISGDTIIEDGQYTLVYCASKGKIDITGGTLRNSRKYLLWNAGGEVNIDYKGKDENDKLEWYGSENNGVWSNSGGKITVNNLYLHDCYVGMRVADSTKEGDVKITNCVIEDSTENGLALVHSSAVLNNLEFRNSGNSSVYVFNVGTVNMENIYSENTGQAGIENYGGTIIAKDVEIISSKIFGIYSGIHGASKTRGNITCENVVIKDILEGNAFNIKYSDLVATDVKINNTKQYAFNIINDSTAVVKNTTVYDTGVIGIRLISGTCKMDATDVKLYRDASEESPLVYIHKDCTMTLNGDSIITGANNSGVCVGKGGTFILNGGAISNNGGTEGTQGAGVRILETGSFIMNGGTITGNNAGEDSAAGVLVKGKFEFNDGIISNNVAGSKGGGIYLSGGSTMKMNGGKIINNKAEVRGAAIFAEGGNTINLLGGEMYGNASANTQGDGIWAGGSGTKFTMSRDFYAGTNTVKVNYYTGKDDTLVLRLTGDKLTKHDNENPLIVAPASNTALGGTVIECDSEASAKAIIDSTMSGDGQFAFYQDGKYIRTVAANADLDMTGVTDVVAVTNYQQLKEAVTTTKTKRIIKVCADIEMEGLITVPSGTTVQIMDDGVQRTLSRKAGDTSQFFYTPYGTGLILQGTSKDKLILDAACTKDVDTSEIKILVVMRGESKLENVKFTNSDNSVYSSTLIGAYVHQQYANATISNCTFENAVCNAAGAIRVRSQAVITDCTFKNNSAVSNEGGAIYAENTGAVVNVSGCTFDGNKAVKGGGAIYFREGAGASTISNSVFVNNVAERAKSVNGGAISVMDNVFVEISDSLFEGNKANSTENDGCAGAIYSKGSLKVTDCQFVENYASSHGAAVYINGENATAVFSKDDGEAIFKENSCNKYGGALLLVKTKKENITISGYEFKSNSGKYGGAISMQQGSGVTISETSFLENKSEGHGGAIDVDNGDTGLSSELLLKNNTLFEGNEAGSVGGAMYIDSATINIEDTQYKANATQTDNGGAIYFKLGTGTADIENTTFTDNTAAKHSGAIFIASAQKVTITDTAFTGNKAGNRGGAMELNTLGVELAISGCTFDSNTAVKHGGAMCLQQGTVTVDDTTFTGNTGGYGSALYLNALVDSTISNVTFENNPTAADGVVSINGASDITLSDLTFTGDNVIGSNSWNKDCVVKVSDKMTNVNFKLANGAFIVPTTGFDVENSIVTITPTTYTAGALVLKAEATSETVTDEAAKKAVADAATKITVTPESGKTYRKWSIKSDGTLYYKDCVATYEELVAAIDNAEQASGASCTIYITNDITMTDAIVIDNKANIILDTEVAEGVTLTRATALNVFQVQSGVKLEIAGKITLDGDKANANLKATQALIRNYGSFTLGKDAVIQNVANTSTSGNDSYGGAVLNKGTLTIKGTLQGNSALYGGAIFDQNGAKTVVIEGALFTGNTSSSHGGAIFIQTNVAQVTITNTTFSGNSSKGRSGAIDLDASGVELEISGCTFTSNTAGATQPGGAMCLQKGTVTIDNTTFTGNTGGRGSALYLNALVDSTISNVTFENNTGATDGVVSINGTSDITLSNLEFKDENNVIGNNDGATTYLVKLAGKMTNVNFKLANSTIVPTTTFDTTSTVTITPATYTAGAEVLKAEATSETVTEEAAKKAVEAAAAVITVTQESAAPYRNWAIASDGTLYCNTYDVTTYDELVAAIADAGQAAGTSCTIYIANDITMTDAIVIDNKANIILDTEVAEGVTLTRATASNVFQVQSGVKLEIAGKITLDGDKANANLKATQALIRNYGSFTLGKDAVIQNAANTSTSGNDSYGGAVLNKGTLTIKGTLQGNSALYGGAIFDQNGAKIVVIEGALFTGNTSSSHGGAIFIQTNVAQVTITNTTFSENEAGKRSGAIDLDAANVKLAISGCTFTSNTAGADQPGGAMCLQKGTVTIDNTTFTGNTGGRGSALYLNALVDSTISNVTFENNSTASDGVVSINGASNITLSDLTFIGNNDIGTTSWNNACVVNISGTMTNAVFEIAYQKVQ